MRGVAETMEAARVAIRIEACIMLLYCGFSCDYWCIRFSKRTSYMLRRGSECVFNRRKQRKFVGWTERKVLVLLWFPDVYEK
jgi:hypothetical protein